MRDVVINNWKENGIKELNYNLLIDGEDTTIDTPSEEVKPEEKPEEKPEVKPETKPEVDSEVKPEQPSKDENVSAGKGDTLPNTGAPISSAQVVVMSLAMVGIGVTMFKKKEDIA